MRPERFERLVFSTRPPLGSGAKSRTGATAVRFPDRRVSGGAGWQTRRVERPLAVARGSYCRAWPASCDVRCMLQQPRSFALGLLLTLLTAACGGGTSDENMPTASTPTDAKSGASDSAVLRTLDVSGTDVIEVGWRELGFASSCNQEDSSESVRIDLSSKHVARIASLRVCGSNADSPTGPVKEISKAELTLSDEQAASVLALANGIEVRTIKQCLGQDGKSFHVTVKHADGTVSSYTDGISFGCDVIAVGQSQLFHQVNAFLPGTPKREPAY